MKFPFYCKNGDNATTFFMVISKTKHICVVQGKSIAVVDYSSKNEKSPVYQEYVSKDRNAAVKDSDANEFATQFLNTVMEIQKNIARPVITQPKP